jgi:acyl carrier protein
MSAIPVSARRGEYYRGPTDEPRSPGGSGGHLHDRRKALRAQRTQEQTVQTVDLDATVRGAVVQLLDVPPERLTVQTPLLDLGIDEDTGFAVLLVVEDALDVRFPDDFLDGLHTYGDLTSAVRRAVGG